MSEQNESEKITTRTGTQLTASGYQPRRSSGLHSAMPELRSPAERSAYFAQQMRLSRLAKL